VKLGPPALPGGRIQRRALHDRLDESFGTRLTTVVAGPGFGKTTLLAAWSEDVVCAWCTLDAGDADLPRFAASLEAALRQRLPGLRELRDADDVDALAARLSDVLADDLSSDLVLVLDDVQELPRRSDSARLIGSLARQAPQELHLVIAAQTELPFTPGRDALTIDAAMLAFSAEEVAELLASLLGSGDGAQALHELTAGWPAAVRLAVETLRNVPAEQRGERIERLARPEGPLFAYVGEEAFARESPAARELVRAVAPLERFDEQLCAELGVRNSAGLLSRLAAGGLLVQRLPGTEFTVHPLIRAYATDRWPLSPDELRALQLRAASRYEERGRLDAAVRSLIASGEHSELRRILSERGAELLAAGAVEDVLRAAELVPDRDERLEQVVGEAHALRGDWDEALACYGRAANGRTELPPALARRIGRLHFDRGELERALEAYRRGRMDGSDAGEEALLLAWTASAHLSHGELDESRSLAAAALERAGESGDARALAVAHNVSMVLALRLQPDQADAHYRAGLDAAEEAGDALQTIRLRSNYAAKLIQEGSYAEALDELGPAVAAAEAAGVPLALAFALLKRGEARVHLSQLELALADLEAARSLYEGLGSSRAYGALMEVGEVYRERGDRTLARTALEQALAGAERAEDVQVVAYALANLARVLAADEPERAQELAERAVETARASGHGLVFALLSSGWVTLVLGDREAAASRASESAAAARERGDRGGLAESLELAAMAALEAEPLAEAAAIWEQLGSSVGALCARLARARLTGERHAAALAERRLQELGVRLGGASAGCLAVLPREEPPPVTIEALGGFRVLLDGKPVPPAAWQSRRARDLVKLLVAARGRPVPRRHLIAELWPGEDPSKTGNRLSVALATARGVVEQAVSADREAVWLEESRVTVDVEDFLAGADRGLRAGDVELLEAAEAAYAGDFLEDDPYEDWAEPLRDEARAAYVSVAAALAELAEGAGDYDGAVRYRLRVVERAGDDEDAHLRLVSTLLAARRHGEARRAYSGYVLRMEQIGAEPAPFPALRPPCT
jgi:ATP/maltotriose-dependent transcriptional regulator MalT/DNA-binding SARP family transcriptional activator